LAAVGIKNFSMKNRVKKQNKKGETMGIRKFISLLYL